MSTGEEKTVKPLLFGVTGGIGCGKSAVCQFLHEQGVAIIAADPLAKDLTRRHPEIRQALSNEFGADVYFGDGVLNVEKLAQLVFTDAAARARVNQIVHPHVFREIQNQVQHLSAQAKLIGVEAALIFESHMDKILNAVVVVSAPLEKRIAWIRKRNRLSREEILKRIQSQMPLSEQVQRAHYVIENDGSLRDLADKVDSLYRWLLERLSKS
ncbi:MAG TPA: dephospho-CoA kinase [bacterium]